MSQRPTITLVDNPVAVTTDIDETTGITQPAEKPPTQRQPRRQEQPAPKRAQLKQQPETAETNPYAGMRKVQAPVRLFPPLWDGLEQIVRELRDEGHDVDKTAVLNAVLHFNGPTDIDAARELVNRWRALLAKPPARR